MTGKHGVKPGLMLVNASKCGINKATIQHCYPFTEANVDETIDMIVAQRTPKSNIFQKVQVETVLQC